MPKNQQTASFPPAWLWLVDEVLPTYVKDRYSPRESWKGKPFTKEDAFFFFKGINELSELFTEERPKQIPAYFQHEKFRSSYLLYFLPLQAAKFLTLFKLHEPAAEAALAHGRKQGKLRLVDLGAGPATASIAYLLWLLGRKLATGEELPPVEIDLVDTDGAILKDGQALCEMFGTHFPRLRGKLTVRSHTRPWWEVAKVLKSEPASLIFIGHVLNESEGPLVQGQSAPQWMDLWGSLLQKSAQGGGILFVEPAARRSSQTLSKLRDGFIARELVEASPSSIWGPCLHAGACPLAEGRDWCHFSVPIEVPGTWFREFSKGLGSERQWVKFAYLWLAASAQSNAQLGANPGSPGDTSADDTAAYRAPIPAPSMRLVVSDRLGADHQATGQGSVLLCEPGEPAHYKVGAGQHLYRGDLIKLLPGR